MDTTVIQAEIDKLAIAEKKLEKLAARTADELASVRTQKAALLTIIKPKDAAKSGEFEQFFNQLKDQMPDIDDDDDEVIGDSGSVIDISTNGHKRTRVPIETKAFAFVNALVSAGNEGYKMATIKTLMLKAHPETPFEESSAYNILNKQIGTGRVKRIGSKYFATPKGLDWHKRVTGTEDKEEEIDIFGQIGIDKRV